MFLGIMQSIIYYQQKFRNFISCKWEKVIEKKISQKIISSNNWSVLTNNILIFSCKKEYFSFFLQRDRICA